MIGFHARCRELGTGVTQSGLQIEFVIISSAFSQEEYPIFLEFYLLRYYCIDLGENPDFFSFFVNDNFL